MDNMLDRQTRGRTHNFVSLEEISKVKSLRKLGLTMKNIGRQLNIARKRVEYILTRRAGG